MKHLYLFITFILIVSCDKQPILLETCLETNKEEVNYVDKYNEYIPEALNLLTIYYEELESSNGVKEKYEKSLINFFEHKSAFLDKLTDSEKEIDAELVVKSKSSYTNMEMLELAKDIQATKIESLKVEATMDCNSQGIY